MQSTCIQKNKFRTLKTEHHESINIEFLRKDTISYSEDLEQAVKLINKVYEVAESGLWASGTQRTSLRELAELIELNQIIVAKCKSRVVGCLRLQHMTSSFQFGMLAVDLNYRNLGIGKGLIDFAEEVALSSNAPQMTLKILTPKNEIYPQKEELKIWYKKLGYQYIGNRNAVEHEPILATLLAKECLFEEYIKQLNLN